MFPHLHAAISAFVSEYGTLAVAGIIFLESFGLPVPGELMLIVGAGLVAHGDANLALFFASAWTAAVLGDNVGYLVGRRLGSAAIVRFGQKFGITAERYQWAEEKFRRVGPVIIAGARFVAVLRQINGLVAGSLRMPWARFALFNAIGAALWVGFWGMLTLVVGRHVDALRHAAHHLGALGLLALLVLLALAVVWRLRRPGPTDAGRPTE